ncbi:MAG: ATP-binding protein [Pseudonocardiaceae bacterium]
MSEFSSPSTPAPMLFVTFTGREITAVRRCVTRHAAQAGLRGDQLHDFVLAVNEIVTNAVVHGGGHGELRLWDNGRTVGCEVVDAGPGGVAEVTAEPARGTDGRGLRLARLLVDDLDVLESPTGTKVRLVAALT